MTPLLRSWARALGGAVTGRSVTCPGPGHSTRDRSLSVTISPSAPNGFLVHSFVGDDPIACLDFVRSKLNLPAFSGRDPQRTHCDISKQHSKQITQPNEDVQHTLSINDGRGVWGTAVSPCRTLVETHLNARFLDLPPEAANEAIRFHERCRFALEYHPAMICLVRNIITNVPQGVHRTALAPDGRSVKRDSKTFRMSLCAISGGAIKLDPDEDVEQGLCIGEGVETCLAGRQMGLRPVWSALNTGGVANFPLLPGVDALHIFKENDARGQSAKAVETCARRWYDAGRTVIIVEPDTAKDLNDELQEAAR